MTWMMKLTMDSGSVLPLCICEVKLLFLVCVQQCTDLKPLICSAV